MKLLQRFNPRHRISFAFDIDGVLKQGKNALPQAIDSLKELEVKRIPYIILTNGGGMLEQEKAEELSSSLQVPISKDQVCLSHSPMKELATQYGHSKVLVIGPDRVREVAKSYGFQNIVMPQDIFNANHHVWPFKKPTNDSGLKMASLDDLHLAAVTMFHDSDDWGRDFQILYDALRSKEGRYMESNLVASRQAIPLYFSNSDLVWRTSFPNLRFAQGSFRQSFAALYQKLSGHPVEYETFGKPTKATFLYAEKMLNSISPPPSYGRTVFMIGDNPQSDIDGANNFGWESVLVTKTGVYREGISDPAHGAKYVFDDVGVAVRSILNERDL